MKSRIVGIAVALIIFTVLSVGCAAKTGSPSSTAAPTATETSLPEGQPVMQLVSVTGPLAPINPGDPVVEVTLKNVSPEPVTSLTATLLLNRPFQFSFDVSASKPLRPGDTVSSRMTLIGGGFDSSISYQLTVQGTVQDGAAFSLTQQVKITNP